MKKTSKLIALIFFTIFGITIGVQFNSMIGGDFTSPHKNEIEAQEVSDLRKTTEDMKTRIIDLKKQVDTLEQARAVESIPLQKLKTTVDEYKFLAGYSPASGPGIIIELDSDLQENIAEVIEGRRYLISLVNELKVFGAEVVSINDYRVVGRSEITLAGNHINVHGKPIAPPYIIQAIGSQDSLKRYVESGTLVFELMASNGITSNIKFSDDIKIPALVKEKPLQFLNIAED